MTCGRPEQAHMGFITDFFASVLAEQRPDQAARKKAYDEQLNQLTDHTKLE